MALGNKTLDDLLTPITKQLEHDGIAEKIDLPEWEFKPARVTDGMSKDQLVDLFAAEAEKIRVQVKRCKANKLAETITAIVCADDDRFAAVGLYDALAAADLVTDVTVWDAKKGDANVDAALVATYGITYASAGIAETGTIVQPTSPKCGRAVSLLPLVHIAVLDAPTIEPTMLEIMKEFEGSKLPSQVCFISGPSATADIELVRVEGVHGPMYVNYVIVE